MKAYYEDDVLVVVKSDQTLRVKSSNQQLGLIMIYDLLSRADKQFYLGVNQAIVSANPHIVVGFGHYVLNLQTNGKLSPEIRIRDGTGMPEKIKLVLEEFYKDDESDEDDKKGEHENRT